MTLTTVKKTGLHTEALDHVFTIGASGNSAYTFQGEGLNGTVNNPTLYLTRGKTYRFENGSGGHPIRIQSTSGASGTAYNTGVTNNAQAGTVIVEVQHDAPDVLYYQCTSHAAMNGILYITGALADGGVTTAKIATDAVTQPKIAASAIHTENINDNAVTTAKITDGAVTAAKIASGVTDLVSDTSPQLGGDLQTNSNNILFPDNDRARFGNSNDLEIYHNGNASFIKEGGTGNLNIATDAFRVLNGATTENMITADENGAVSLYHDNSKKVETTSIGANLTGTVLINTNTTSGISSSADDLVIGSISDTVSRGLTIATSADCTIRFADAGDNAMGRIQYLNTTDVMTFHTANVPRLRVDADGLKFGSDSAASNALDDYEEGFFDAINNYNTVWYSNANKCSYTKIGRVVTVCGQIRQYSGTGQIQLSLPFNIASNTNNETAFSCVGALGIYEQDTTSGAVNVIVLANGGDSFCYFMESLDNAVWGHLNTDADAYLRFTFTYFTS